MPQVHLILTVLLAYSAIHPYCFHFFYHSVCKCWLQPTRSDRQNLQAANKNQQWSFCLASIINCLLWLLHGSGACDGFTKWNNHCSFHWWFVSDTQADSEIYIAMSELLGGAALCQVTDDTVARRHGGFIIPRAWEC